MACISFLILRNISCMGKNMIACVLRVYKHVLDWLLFLILICWLLWIFFLPPSFQHLTKLFIFPAKFRWICSLSTTALMSGNAVCYKSHEKLIGRRICHHGGSLKKSYIRDVGFLEGFPSLFIWWCTGKLRRMGLMWWIFLLAVIWNWLRSVDWIKLI